MMRSAFQRRCPSALLARSCQASGADDRILGDGNFVFDVDAERNHFAILDSSTSDRS